MFEKQVMSGSLKVARAIIEDKSHWCQKALYRDSNGRSLWDSSNPAAVVQACAAGAVLLAARACLGRTFEAAKYRHAMTGILDTAGIELYGDGYGIVRVNDQLGHEAVLRVFDTAIAKLQVMPIDSPNDSMDDLVVSDDSYIAI